MIKKFLSNSATWLSLTAILLAMWLAQKPVMIRIGYVVSDQIARGLGVVPSHRVLLVRLDQTLAKQQLENLLANAIPALLKDYRAEVVGVDMDFFSGQAKYLDLAAALAKTAAGNNDPGLRDSVIWAVAYKTAPQTAAATSNQSFHDAFCEDCAKPTCAGRFTPNPVFGSNADPQNYGLAVALPDNDGVTRWSPRFVCQNDTQANLDTFHFKIVEAYCARSRPKSELATCRHLQQNLQAKSRIYAWYQTESIDLCRLVNCHTQTLGTTEGIVDSVRKQFQDKLANNIVILYWDELGSDEHMTMLGTEKGAAVVASLIENELQFGEQPHSVVLLLKYSIEGIFVVLLAFLFHSKYTKSLAILIAFGLFALYLRLAPQLSSWVPDFRDYVFVLILAFWLEVLLKSAYQDVVSGIRANRRTAE